MALRQLNIHMQKKNKKNLDSYLTLYININFNCIINLNGAKAIKLLEKKKKKIW